MNTVRIFEESEFPRVVGYNYDRAERVEDPCPYKSMDAKELKKELQVLEKQLDMTSNEGTLSFIHNEIWIVKNLIWAIETPTERQMSIKIKEYDF